VDEFLAYINTWSAYQTLKEIRQTKPEIPDLWVQFNERLRNATGGRNLRVVVPMFIILCRKKI